MKAQKIFRKKTWILLLALVLVACEQYDLEEPGSLVPLTVEEDPALPYIIVNETMLHSEAFGDPNDPMILCIHGGPGADYRSMLQCRDLVSDGYYVVFYDQRGSGLSQRHNGDEGVFTTQQFIDDLDEVIKHYQSSEAQRIIFLGHSWGAMLATGFVDQYPERVDGLILSEPGGFNFTQTFDYVIRSQSLEFFGEASNDFVFQEMFLSGDDHEVLDYKMLISDVVNSEGIKAFWRFGAVCNTTMFNYARESDFDFTGNLDQYTKPVLFAYSELNTAYGKEHAELLSSSYLNVELVLIEGVGHSMTSLGWESYYPVVMQYLDNIAK